MFRERVVLGVRIIFDLRTALVGLTELPAHFAIVNNDNVVIVGNPGVDLEQYAIAETGLRSNVNRYPAGQGLEAVKGTLVNLVA